MLNLHVMNVPRRWRKQARLIANSRRGQCCWIISIYVLFLFSVGPRGGALTQRTSPAFIGCCRAETHHVFVESRARALAWSR
jgi:hypothetical protein